MDGIEQIGELAFLSCSALEKINIPNSVEKIQAGAFIECNLNFTTVDYICYIDNWVVDIDFDALVKLSKRIDVSIKEGTIGIADQSMIPNPIISEINLPNGLKYIGERAFNGLSIVDQIAIPDSVVYVGEGAFAECGGLKSIEVSENNQACKLINGNLYTKDGKTLLRYLQTSVDGSFEIPDSVTKIGNDAFSSTDITNVIIPKSVTHIGEYLFTNCKSLLEINCEAQEQPSEWEPDWIVGVDQEIVCWGYKAE